MFALISFPWPVPSANAPLIVMSSRPVPQPPEPAGSVTEGKTGQRRSLVVPKV